jgi:4-azaleucine resistance transporter AzlC
MATTGDDHLGLAAARRQLLLDTAGIAVSVAGFGFVFGLAARNAGYSPIEAAAMSTIGFAGAAQFAAVGYVSAGLPWLPIVVLTLLLNARHLLYSASLAPHLRHVPAPRRAAMAHVLTDEAFALSAAHFHRLGRTDVGGYWIGAVLGVFVPWNLATLAGVLAGGAVPDPTALGLDVVFPAAMAGLAVGLVTGRREVVAAGSGAAIGVVLSLAIGPALGIMAGGLAGPLLGMATPAGRDAVASSHPGIPVHAGAPIPLPHDEVDVDEALEELEELEELPPDDAGAAARGTPT